MVCCAIKTKTFYAIPIAVKFISGMVVRSQITSFPSLPTVENALRRKSGEAARKMKPKVCTFEREKLAIHKLGSAKDVGGALTFIQTVVSFYSHYSIMVFGPHLCVR